MAVGTFNFTTGPATLPDVGILSYNGCTFSPLFETNVSGTVVKDNARRTTKYMEYVLTADGYVTLAAGNKNINPTMVTLRDALTAQGGYLQYQGRGFDLTINAPLLGGGRGIGERDVAWGPVPELLEFQPLGGGLSAKVKWKVTVRVSELVPVPKTGPLLQFNEDTVITIGDDGYTTIAVRGTMEIPMTRGIQTDRSVPAHVDDYRSQLDARLFSRIDLSIFRVTRRNYQYSRDKRTMEFDVEVEEKPYMDLPPGCTLAHGSYSVRPVKAGAGLCNWMCTLRATYNVRGDAPRRIAWLAFLCLLRLRMYYSITAADPGPNQNPGPGVNPIALNPIVAPLTVIGMWANYLKGEKQDTRRAWLIDFSIDEGLYLDSKTVSFSAAWRLVTTFDRILLASGVWRKVPEKDAQGKNMWATYMKDVSGSIGELNIVLDPKKDIIVDFGGG